MPRHPRLAGSAAGLSDRVYSALADLAKRLPGPVYPLHVGDTWLEPLPSARAEAQRSADHPRLHNYAAVQGEPALLDAICRRLERRHGAHVERDAIQVMPGATTGLAVVVAALLDPGDELILPSPFWPLIRGITQSRGCLPVEVPFFTRLADPSFDPEEVLERAVTPRTAALYVNTPHNPTGAVLSREVVAAIARVAARHDLWVISDEAYEDLAYGAELVPLWRVPELQDRTVAMHTLSKSYALAGARVGYAHGPADAMQAIRGAQVFLAYCAAKPMQLAAAHALDDGDEWLDRTRRAYADAARLVGAALGIPAPPAGTFAFFDAAPHFRPGEQLPGFLERCLEAGVLLTPGPAVGRDFETWVRLCFTAVPPHELERALERLAAVMRRA